jgi:phosphoribosylformylglycinamidine synthase
MLGYLGVNVPQTDFEANLRLYRAVSNAFNQGLITSARGIYRGGLGVHLALSCLGGDLGADFDLEEIENDGRISPEKCLFSESMGRFIVSVRPEDQNRFEEMVKGLPSGMAGRVRQDQRLIVTSGSEELIRADLEALRTAFKLPFGDLI